MRRFFQFSLRTLLAFMVVCSLAFAWVGAKLREWKAEQGALVAIGPAAVEYESGPAALPIFS
ncbi:MAG: hypothetical protein ACR2FY_09925 [Pirellulaceae bacterium]